MYVEIKPLTKAAREKIDAEFSSKRSFKERLQMKMAGISFDIDEEGVLTIHGKHFHLVDRSRLIGMYEEEMKPLVRYDDYEVELCQ